MNSYHEVLFFANYLCVGLLVEVLHRLLTCL
jgi:hypothetical protein